LALSCSLAAFGFVQPGVERHEFLGMERDGRPGLGDDGLQALELDEAF
jgi:hypothetical protein